MDNFAEIKSDIQGLRAELNTQNERYHKLRNKVVGMSVIMPFLVSATFKKIDTPPKAIQETVQDIIKSSKE